MRRIISCITFLIFVEFRNLIYAAIEINRSYVTTVFVLRYSSIISSRLLSIDLTAKFTRPTFNGSEIYLLFPLSHAQPDFCIIFWGNPRGIIGYTIRMVKIRWNFRAWNFEDLGKKMWNDLGDKSYKENKELALAMIQNIPKNRDSLVIISRMR